MTQKQQRPRLDICMISGSYPPILDGVGEYAERLIHALKAASQELHLIAVTSIWTAGSDKKEGDLLRIIKKWNMRSIPVMLGIIKHKKPAIVHIQYPAKPYGRNASINLLPLIIKCFLPHIKIISTIHEFSIRTRLGKWRLLLNMAWSDRIIVVDRSYEEAIRRYLPSQRKKLEFIPVASNILPPRDIPPDKIAETKRGLGFENTDIILCYFGIIRPGKGIPLLLEALADVSAKYNNIRMLLIGRHYEDYYNNCVSQLVHDLDLENKAVFTGPCDGELISRYLAVSDICVLPFEDGVSTRRTTLMAALQHRLPIITTKPKILPEGLVDHENILLFEFGDRPALVSRIDELIEDKNLRSKLSQNARWLARLYSWENIANKTINVYYDVLDEG